MSKIVWIIFGLIVLFGIGKIIINNIKDKAYQKGYDHGESDVVAKIIDTSYWFTSADKQIYNTLQLFGLRYKKYRGFIANQFREDILKMDHTKHFTELPKEEVDRLI